MASEENKRYGFLGWQEFLSNRKDLLNEFDKALSKNINRPIRTSHGNAGEAAVRKLLTSHLPQRFGVTSGYIIPDIISNDYTLYHYDIIIYDKINSPILWIEDDFDTSEQGKKRAIPAKYILSVIEVKSTFNDKNVKDAMSKISELKNLKEYLHPYFSSNVFFFDIKNTEIDKVKILDNFLCENYINFWGGIILRSELNTEMTGLIKLTKISDEDVGKNKETIPLVRDVNETELFTIGDGNVSLSNGAGGMFIDKKQNVHFSKKYISSREKDNIGVNIIWSYSSFADYIIQILNCLENKDINSSEKHIFGKVFDKVEFRG